MAVDPPVSTSAGAAVTTAVTIGGIVANHSSIVAPTNLTQATSVPLVSSQIQLQVALQVVQIANGGLLNTSVADVQQVPIFSPGLTVPGPFKICKSLSKLM